MKVINSIVTGCAVCGVIMLVGAAGSIDVGNLPVVKGLVLMLLGIGMTIPAIVRSIC